MKSCAGFALVLASVFAILPVYLAVVTCPGLFQIGDRDTIASAPGATAQAKRLGPLAQTEHCPIGHFDIYEGAHFERVVASQIAFLKKNPVDEAREQPSISTEQLT